MRSIPEFAKLLQFAQVSLVIDVRTVPRSRRNPQFNEDVLGSELADYQVGYERIAALGGLRGRSPDVPKAANAFWNNESSPQLRRLCVVGSIYGRSRRTARSQLDGTMCDNVRRSCVVAMSPANHRGLLVGQRQDRASPDGKRSY